MAAALRAVERRSGGGGVEDRRPLYGRPVLLDPSLLTEAQPWPRFEGSRAAVEEPDDAYASALLLQLRVRGARVVASARITAARPADPCDAVCGCGGLACAGLAAAVASAPGRLGVGPVRGAPARRREPRRL